MRMGAALIGGVKGLGLSKPLLRLVFRQLLFGRSRQRAFAGYVATEHDVFVATFGKSGTNWMMQIAQQIAHRGEAEFDHIHDVVAWPDAPGGMGLSLSNPSPREQSPTGLRVIKTHLESDLLPYGEKSVYLTIVRDPKEVLVSSYCFLGGILGVLGHVGIDDWFDLFVAPRGMAVAWARHTAGFWRWRERPNALVLDFSEVMTERRRCIERVATVMGVDLSDDQLARVVERSSFVYMKAHASQFDPPPTPLSKGGERPQMIRRGKSGASDELLSRAQQAAVDGVCQAELARLGSDFPYAERF
jgi:hypothetical protein